MPETGNALSRNPNICASCSSMADGMEDSVVTESTSLQAGQELTAANAEILSTERPEDGVPEPVAHHVSIRP